MQEQKEKAREEENYVKPAAQAAERKEIEKFEQNRSRPMKKRSDLRTDGGPGFDSFAY